jgi:hypothetical protein
LHPSGTVPRSAEEEALAKVEIPMPRKFAMPSLIAVLALAGCAGPNRVGVAVAAGGPDYYDGYYDGYYGPFVDGYWGDDGAFWYQDGGHAWHSDAAPISVIPAAEASTIFTAPARTGPIEADKKRAGS